MKWPLLTKIKRAIKWRKMKWPSLLLMIRHDVSLYNVLKKKKRESKLYKEFLEEFVRDKKSNKAKVLALEVWQEFALNVSDAETSLFDESASRAEKVGRALREKYAKEPPKIIFISPYRRTKLTFAGLKRGWPELEYVKTVEEERLREQEHGLATICNDWRVFHVLHPEQAILYNMEGRYWYRYPQGENVPDVRVRSRSWTNTVVRDFARENIMAISHHLEILSTMANFERWGEEEFILFDENDKPINCGVTAYRGDPTKGKNGKFVLEYYNKCFY
jgi:broad specificity phosphatase PhoE